MARTSTGRIGTTAVVLALCTLGSTPASAADEPTPRATPIVVRVEGGFSLTDAGIGVVAGAGAALAAVGGVALVRARDRTPHGSKGANPDDDVR